MQIVTPPSSASLKTLALAPDAGGLGVGALLPAAVLRRRIAGRERRTQRHACVGHQLEDLGRAAVAVFNRLARPPCTARRMPSGVDACTTTGRPMLFAVWTMRFISSCENVGVASPFGPAR